MIGNYGLSHTPDNFYRDKTSNQWSSPHLPIPEIIKIDSYQNHYYAISPFFQGEPFENLLVAALEQTLPDFLSMMTALQTINLDSIKGFGRLIPTGQGAYVSWTEALLDVNNDHPYNLNHGWKKILSEIPEMQLKFNYFYKKLSELVQFCPSKKSLIHSDLLYQNLLVHDFKISAVLDWGCAMVGDPVYDIALIAFFEPWFPAFTQVNLIQKIQQSYLNQSSENHQNFSQRMVAYQIHLTLDNIAHCAFSKQENYINDHINRLEEILKEANH